MEIRPEIPSDGRAISDIITAAFLGAEHSGGNETSIVELLRKAGSLAVSLVATENAEIVGHVAFSPVTIEGQSDGWFGLAQSQLSLAGSERGIGSALIEAGLDMLRARGSKGCVVLGSPAYYSRFGFAVDPDLRLTGVPPEYFQQLKFEEHPCAGEVKYDAAFGMA